MKKLILCVALLLAGDLSAAEGDSAVSDMQAFDETGARCSKQRSAIEAGFKEFHVWKRAADRGERPPINSLRQAGVSLNRAVSEGCADGLVVYRLANIHRQLGDCVTAMQIFHSAENDLIANYSEHYQNYLFQGMGKCSESSAEAALYYQRALNANPDDIGSRINMAYRMMNAGQLNESFAVLKELLENRRDSLSTNGLASVYNNLGWLMFKSKDAVKAAEYFQFAYDLRKSPRDVEGLAYAYEYLNDRKNTDKWWRVLIALYRADNTIANTMGPTTRERLGKL